MAPLAEIRRLSSECRHRDAEKLLLPLLEKSPTDPALLAELANIYCYTARETDAVWLLDRVPQAAHLRDLLAKHFAARLALSPNDADAQSCYSHLGGKLKAGVKITACLIVKNEEANLLRCLASLQKAVNEIVVVDTGSSDDTILIAETAKAKVGHFEWCDDFAAARNHALSFATGDWILWIDADEELTPESITALREAVCRPHFGGFNAEIVNFTSDEGESTIYVHHAVRLFQRHDGIRFSGRIHEQITPALEDLNLPWANLPGFRILHHGYRPSAMAERNKILRTTTMLEAEIRENPTDAFTWFNLANAYTVAARWPEAEHAARMCSRHIGSGSDFGALNYQFLANALTQQTRFVEALQACDAADASGYGGLFIEFERANTLYKVGNLPKALEAATQCCEAQWPAHTTGDRGIFDSKRWILRGQILALLERFDEALEMFAKTDHPMSIYSRAATLERAGKPAEALEVFLDGRKDGSIAQICNRGAGRCCLSLGLPKQASEFFKAAWELEPEDYECWVEWAKACDMWGDLPSIVSAYEAFAAKHNPSPEILVNWGRALELSGDHDRALACYTEAIQRDENNANAYFNAGDLLYKIGQYQDAAHLYQTGLRLAPKNAQGWFVLGNSLAQLGIVQGAKLGYEQALVIDPTHEAAKHNLQLVTSDAD